MPRRVGSIVLAAFVTSLVTFALAGCGTPTPPEICARSGDKDEVDPVGDEVRRACVIEAWRLRTRDRPRYDCLAKCVANAGYKDALAPCARECRLDESKDPSKDDAKEDSP